MVFKRKGGNTLYERIVMKKKKEEERKKKNIRVVTERRSRFVI
jgi:hypothetical protein